MAKSFIRQLPKPLGCRVKRFRSCFNLFRGRLRPILKPIGVRDFCQQRAIDKNQGIQDARQGRNMSGTYLFAMIILFLNKFKTASYQEERKKLNKNDRRNRLRSTLSSLSRVSYLLPCAGKQYGEETQETTVSEEKSCNIQGQSPQIIDRTSVQVQLT